MARSVTEKGDLGSPLLELFCDFGIDGVSVAMVSKKTGLGKGSIYYFFPSGKPDMVEFVLNNAERNLSEKMFVLTDHRMKGKRGIEEFLNFFVSDKVFLNYIHFLSILVLSKQRLVYLQKINLFYEDMTSKLSRAIAKEGYSPSKAWNIAENVTVSIYGSYLFSCSLSNKSYFTNRIKKLNKIVSENLKTKL
ncbi:TetR/AcrR family transcriptional regulator [Leptospira sp. 2 VSF19]|uniref:TetR/AcrR family transcriptional regulator n=1 Tax=Leptospira soteropolitanensis TaxID=2950025 RepID=A0AAW5VLY4_9LEPT|nr:TetR/AcrR family transcriptional regulator [Leptospira soteropolitanensis]MCW7493566.1 TetR/AcrR family transcriptional regulator [Leptospira soteropolitanensis]MCW7501165.1 TetR/AcrR family transcriptional regulator [Leptospira soteropolitanensis]MCW7523649.1 TetR/AcrR family transcriptional regulator [Leptospira soteropolitanensis]MCW7527278.1 TetR/AcrR family transcriptional regulator [Leptospira soteropolitanensis]MCW7531135.1 TetR/AcrR family transcriptional regulator [Leptospira soter